MKHVKENDLAHGEYEKWLDSIEINKQQAHRFVKVFEEFNGGKVTTSLHLGLSTLYEIATLPPEHREVPHELPTGETKKPEEMTVRELRELKRQLKQAEKQTEAERKDFLRQKESNMRQIVGKAYTELGKELYEAQQRLSKNGYGCFGEWAASIGFNRQQAQNLIKRHELIVKNFDKRDMLEDMPVSLTYEIARPSSEDTPAKDASQVGSPCGRHRYLKGIPRAYKGA